MNCLAHQQEKTVGNYYPGINLSDYPRYVVELFDISTVISVPDFEQPLMLLKNASGKGIGCAWHHMPDGQLSIHGLASRTLLGAEKKSYRSKLEFLALKWAVRNHFSDYLYCVKHFDVYSDFLIFWYISKLPLNKKWTFPLRISSVNVTRSHLLKKSSMENLDNLNFPINYQPGIENNFANTLSRFLNSTNNLKIKKAVCLKT